MAYGGAGTLFALSGGVFTPIDLAMAGDRQARRGRAGQAAVRADQRHPHRIQQGRQSRRQRDADADHRPRERNARAARAHHPHRRHHAPVEARRIRSGAAAVLAHCAPPRCTPCPASTTPPMRPSRNTSTDSARPPTTRATTASITPACTSSALINVLQFKPGGLGHPRRRAARLGCADLKGRSSSTPIVVFAHMPLWTIYEPWGWGTGDADQLMEPACAASVRSRC